MASSIKIRKKVCEGKCGQLAYIYKNHRGQKLCKKCWRLISCSPTSSQSKPTVQSRSPRPVLKMKSDKQSKLDIAYKVLREQYLKDNPLCLVHFPGICLQVANQVHHVYSGSHRSKYYLETKEWKPICSACHKFGHDVLTQQEAIDLGFKKVE